MSNRHRARRFHDVDVWACVIIGVMAVATYVGLVHPQQSQAREMRAVADAVTTTQAHVDITSARLTMLSDETRRLREVVAVELSNAPSAANLNTILGAVLEHAAAVGLEIKSVLPRPAEVVDEYLATDVHIEARGDMRTLISFLDVLARRQPYHSIREYSLVRQGDDESQTPSISLVLRLYLLTDATVAPSGTPS